MVGLHTLTSSALVGIFSLAAFSAAAASSPVYTKHADSFCTGNFDANNHTFFESNDAFEQCKCRCAKTYCACFDVRAASSAHGPALCRLTNYSSAVRGSADHFDAYTDQSRPPPPDPRPVSPGGLSRYGCVGNFSAQPFCDRSLPLGDRVKALIALLTPEEKGRLMTARTTAQSNAIPRLGVPLFCWGQNSAQGYLQTAMPEQGGGITTFPRAPGMAATWNMTAVRQQGAVFATEARSIFNQGSIAGSTFSCPGSVVLWGPTINLNRDPRWGRNGETASEDPWFNSLYGAAYADGAQRPSAADLGGREPAANVSYPLKTIVTLKHWGAYSVDLYKNSTVEAHRQSFDANVSAFDMSDSYAPTFEGAVRGATAGTLDFMGALGVMCSYNEVNGIPACASRSMQTDTLRGHWHFQGYVVGDSDTVQFINTEHHYSNSPADATRAALMAGTDLESWCSGGNSKPNYYRDLIPLMLRNGSLPAEVVDLSLTRLLTLRFRAGLFDPPAASPAYFDIGPYDRGTEAFTADALDAARQSMTLLRNSEGALPLEAGQRLLLVGPYAEYGETGNASNTSGKIADELAQLNGAAGITTTVKGCAVSGSDKSGFVAATAAVEHADTVVLLLGCDGSKEHESMDRLDVVLPQIQSEFALAILSAANGENQRRRRAGTAAAIKVVLVLLHYGEISTEELLGTPVGGSAAAAAAGTGSTAVGIDGLLMAFMPHYGAPVAEALFGSFCVGGKLPYTVYPNNYTAGTDFLDMSLQAGEGRGYRFYSGQPLFEFGSGMSGCTSFVLTMMPPPPAPSGAGPGLGASGPAEVLGRYEVQVTNTGRRFGTETVQLYICPPQGLRWGAPLPKRRLLDFRKVALPPAAKQVLSFAVTAEQLMLTDVDGTRKRAPGKFVILITNGNGAALRTELTAP
eukprot:g989.t1